MLAHAGAADESLSVVLLFARALGGVGGVVAAAGPGFPRLPTGGGVALLAIGVALAISAAVVPRAAVPACTGRDRVSHGRRWAAAVVDGDVVVRAPVPVASRRPATSRGRARPARGPHRRHREHRPYPRHRARPSPARRDARLDDLRAGAGGRPRGLEPAVNTRWKPSTWPPTMGRSIPRVTSTIVRFETGGADVTRRGPGRPPAGLVGW